MAKVNHFTSVASAELGERIPKVAGAWYFGLPYRMDQDVTWADYFGGIEPRAFLVGKRDADHATRPDQVYPLDLATIQAGLVDGATQAAIDAAEAEAARFIGVAIEGTDYEDDENMTVALAGGVPAKYVQQDQTLAAYVLDPAVKEVVESGLLAGTVNLVKGDKYLFWNTVQ